MGQRGMRDVAVAVLLSSVLKRGRVSNKCQERGRHDMTFGSEGGDRESSKHDSVT